MTPVVLVLLLAVPAVDSGGALRWHAALGYGFEAFARDRAAWHAASAQVGRRFDHGTVIGELLAARRFDRTDEGLAVDAYRTLWPRAYGNLRVQVDPDAEVLPRLDVAAELFQGVARGFELSGGYRRMQYPNDQADLFTAGAGKYTGNWYLRARAIVVPREGATAVSGSVAVRRYFATTDDYLDVQGGIGEELITVGTGPSGPLVDVRQTRYVAATWRRFVTARLGLTIGATYNAIDGFPDRRGLSFGLMQRW